MTVERNVRPMHFALAVSAYVLIVAFAALFPQSASATATPSGLTYACSSASSNGTQVTLMWNYQWDASYYALRINNMYSCPAGWFSASYGECDLNGITSTSYVVSITPGASYGWWLHAVDWSNNWSTWSGLYNFSCAAEPPSCTAGYVCWGTSLYYKDSICNQTYQHECSYGCSSTNGDPGQCNSAPPPPTYPPPSCSFTSAPPTVASGNSTAFIYNISNSGYSTIQNQTGTWISYISPANASGLSTNSPILTNNTGANTTATFYIWLDNLNNNNVAIACQQTVTITPAPPSCTAQYYCSGSDKRWQSSDCSTLFIQTCSYGCSGAGLCSAPSCSNGLNYSSYGPGCTCPSGQTQSGSSCVVSYNLTGPPSITSGTTPTLSYTLSPTAYVFHIYSLTTGGSMNYDNGPTYGGPSTGTVQGDVQTGTEKYQIYAYDGSLGSWAYVGPTVTVNVTLPPPPTCSISFDTNPIAYGSGTYLRYSSANASSFYINVLSYVTPNISYYSWVAPGITTSYTGFVSGPGGSANCTGTQTLTVNAPANCSFNGQTVNHNSSVTANQTSSVAYGSQCVTEPRTCTNGTLSGSYAYASCTVNPPPTSCTLSLNQLSITRGEYATLSWTSTGATGGTISPGAINAAPVSSGSYSVNPQTSTTYTGSFTGPGGSASCNAGAGVTLTVTCGTYSYCSGNTVESVDNNCNVTPGPTCTPPSSLCIPNTSTCVIQQPIVTQAIKVKPALVRLGATTAVSWNIGNVQSCSITENNLAIVDSWTGLTGSYTSSAISRQTVYTLTCQALSGVIPTSFTETATVNVTPVFQEK